MKIKPPKKKIIKDMRKGIVQFSFHKLNTGELREMRATLMNKHIPEKELPESDQNVTISNDLVKCFDVDAEGWRSFRISTLESYDGIIGN
jgi:hypothetical protein